jgi:hypothetical protein
MVLDPRKHQKQRYKTLINRIETSLATLQEMRICYQEYGCERQDQELAAIQAVYINLGETIQEFWSRT